MGSKCLTLLSACSCSYCVYHPLCHSAITSKTYFPVPSVSTIIPGFLQTPVRHISCSCCVYHPVWDSSINRKTYFLLVMCLPSSLSFCNDQLDICFCSSCVFLTLLFILQTPVKHFACSSCVYHPPYISAITRNIYFPAPAVSFIISVILQSTVKIFTHEILPCLPSFLSFCNYM